MSRVRVVCLIACLIFGLGIFVGPVNQQQAMAKSEGVVSPLSISPEQSAPPEEDRIEFDTKYPALSGAADSPFEFEVGIRYLSAKEETLDFDLKVEVPQGWISYIAESKYAQDNELSAISLEPYGIKEKILVVAIAPFWLYPEPGDYTLTLEISSGEVRGSIDLTARITARYDLSAETKLESGRLNIKAEADKENYLPISVTNTGTATLDKVTLSSSKPEGWSVTFNPEKVESLSAGTSQEIEVTVKPPAKTIAGDYMITLKFAGEPSSYAPDLDIRVTVGTSTRWGLVGVGIVIAIIAGLVVTFMRLGRR